MLKLIGAGMSPWARRVLVVLDEKGIEYEHEIFFPFGDPSDEFKEKSPLALIPVLETEEGPLADSTAICAYLEARFPAPPLFPTDPYERGRSVWFSEYAEALFKHEGTIFFQKAVRGHLMKQEPDQQAVDAARDAVLPFLAYLEKELDGRSYLVGDTPYLGDITLASVLLNYLHAGEQIESVTYPNLRAFLDRMFERKSFADRIEDDLEALSGLSTVGR
jgi:glutathione S-transferase